MVFVSPVALEAPPRVWFVLAPWWSMYSFGGSQHFFCFISHPFAHFLIDRSTTVTPKSVYISFYLRKAYKRGYEISCWCSDTNLSEIIEMFVV